MLGGSGSGKSFFMNHLVRQYWEQGTHVVLVDTGNSYQGLCELIRRKTKGEDGVYFTYTEEHPISFNPFYTDDYYFDVEKKDSIKTLLLTLWKTEDDKITKTESGELGSAVNAYIERIRADRNIVPCFDSFYEYLRDDYRRELEEREIRVSREDFNIDNMLITLRQYYKGGRYDFLLNSRANIDLLSKRFVVFEVDSIKENKELFSRGHHHHHGGFHKQDETAQGGYANSSSSRRPGRRSLRPIWLNICVICIKPSANTTVRPSW